MKNSRPVSDLPRLLQTAGWLWLGYLAALLVIDQFLYHAIRPMLFNYLINGCAAGLFLGLAYWTRLQHLLKKMYLPLMLVLIAGLPLVVNHLMQNGMRDGNLSNPEGMALRQLPVLFVALVITAWQYGASGVILFSGGTALVELLMVVRGLFSDFNCSRNWPVARSQSSRPKNP
jgi:hypothetical protein